MRPAAAAALAGIALGVAACGNSQHTTSPYQRCVVNIEPIQTSLPHSTVVRDVTAWEARDSTCRSLPHSQQLAAIRQAEAQR